MTDPANWSIAVNVASWASVTPRACTGMASVRAMCLNVTTSVIVRLRFSIIEM
jgi:hypothetical protein